ncbi:MAG: hypothetical protein OMM_05987 [Candidatus Magnetoglobus multicellularis str. Araruama]|uniref:Uncharacterized protein n=1 Tax=Candidatus Magnetoglobus multicellularis str. Araruama TaxID=890399 RepID=A0A1V1NSP6_9BACT|nr:MAG: hypothetical protein OMM_05987 [Candidatus Magnetoglobus multicellularis str. Araruama]
METCPSLEYINYHLSNKCHDDALYSHLAKCDDCRIKFAEASRLIEACKDIEWAQISRPEARRVMRQFQKPSIFERLKEKIVERFQSNQLRKLKGQWIIETNPLVPNSVLCTTAELRPIAYQWEQCRKSKAIYSFLPLKRHDISLILFVNKSDYDPVSYELYLLNVTSGKKRSSLQFDLWQKDHFCASRSYTSMNSLFKSNPSFDQIHICVGQNKKTDKIQTISRDEFYEGNKFYMIKPIKKGTSDIYIETFTFTKNLSCGEYHLIVKEISQDVCQFKFKISDKGLS